MLETRVLRRSMAAVAVGALLLGTGCRSVSKEAGTFHVRATGFNILFFTLPEANFEIAKRLMDEEVGETARITNIESRGQVPPWYNVFNRIIGADVYDIYGTY